MREKMRTKKPEELELQVESTTEVIGESIIPPSARLEELISLTPEELRQKFPRRYEIYTQLLREAKDIYLPGVDKFRETGKIPKETTEAFRRWLELLNSLDKYIAEHEQIINARILHEVQFDVFKTLREFIENGGTSGWIKLPTGTGKTVLFIELLKALNTSAIIAVPTNILVEQTKTRFQEFAPDIDVGKLNQFSKEFGKSILVTTYSSLIRKVDNGELKLGDYELLILDEAHKAIGKKVSDIVKSSPSKLKLGFTATPKYTEEHSLHKILGLEIYRMDIAEAIRKGLLANTKTWIARVDIDFSQVQVNKLKGDFKDKDVEKAINRKIVNEGAVELYKRCFNGQRAIIFCSGIKHAKDVADLFKRNKIPAESISGKISRKKRLEILERFHNGDLLVLCNALILTEGFDEPRTSVCINLRPTLSAVIAEQRAGRVLRLDPENPNKEAVIVDVIPFKLMPNLNKHIITFSEVLGGAAVSKAIHFVSQHDLRKVRKKKEIKKTKDIEKLIATIKGFEVIIEPERVINVVRNLQAYKFEEKESGVILVDGKVYLNKALLQELLKIRKELLNKLELPPPFIGERGIFYYSVEEVVTKILRYFSHIIKEQELANEYLTPHRIATILNIKREQLKKIIDRRKTEISSREEVEYSYYYGNKRISRTYDVYKVIHVHKSICWYLKEIVQAVKNTYEENIDFSTWKKEDEIDVFAEQFAIRLKEEGYLNYEQNLTYVRDYIEKIIKSQKPRPIFDQNKEIVYVYDPKIFEQINFEQIKAGLTERIYENYKKEYKMYKREYERYKTAVISYREEVELAEKRVKENLWKKRRFSIGINPKTGEKQWECIERQGNIETKYVVKKFSRQPSSDKLLYYFSEDRTVFESTGRVTLIKPGVTLEKSNEYGFKVVLVTLQPPYPEDEPKEPKKPKIPSILKQYGINLEE